MTNEPTDIQLPAIIEEYLSRLAGRIKNRRVRADVLRELREHFIEALADVEEKDREHAAGELIGEFGSPDLLAELIKRAKKRGRPAWQKFVIRSLQTVFGLLILLIVYSLWWFLDKPSPTVDYVADLNAQARPTTGEAQNGAPFYIKAIEGFVDLPKSIDIADIGDPGVPLSSTEEQAIRHWIDQNELALDFVREASRKPHAWFTYKGEDVTSILLPHVGAIRAFAQLSCWRIWLVDGEDQEKILVDIHSAYTMARHLQETGSTLIEQLVGIALNSLSMAQTRQLLRAGKTKTESLPFLAKILDETYPQGYPKMNLGSELTIGMDIIQRTFTNGGIGGGHLCPQAFIEHLKFVYNGEQKLRDKLMKKPLFFFIITHPRREETTQKLKEYYALVDQWNVSPYDRSLKPKNPCEEFLAKNKNNLFLSVFIPALDQTVVVNYRSMAEFEATRTVVALLQYWHDRGRYPETLKELVPAYLKHLPRDPYGPDALIYRRNGEDFLLYSRGINLRDDGGKHSPKWGYLYTGKALTTDGDYLFWPPELPERKH